MSLAEPILEALDGLPWWGKWLSTIIISMLPIIELRGALPASRAVFNLPLVLAYFLSVVGNLIPVPFLLAFFPRVEKWLRRFRIFEKFFNWLFERTRRKGENKVKLWGEMGLILFVAIPLPVTGAWTGTLLSYLMALDRVKSFIAITVGVLVAGVIMTLWVEVGPIWGILVIVALILILVVMERLEEHLLEKKNTSG